MMRLEAEIRDEVADEMQAQIAQIHETYQRCMNEQTNTTQRR
jgi:hypothetical protein